MESLGATVKLSPCDMEVTGSSNEGRGAVRDAVEGNVEVLWSRNTGDGGRLAFPRW